MTYFGFLARFLVVPLLALCGLLMYDFARKNRYPPSLDKRRAWGAVLAHVIIAVLYTTPWDNFLVARKVWWYVPERVAGITLAWVPLEEYMFFVLQTLLVGMWVLILARRLMRVGATGPNPPVRLRLLIPLVTGGVWLAALAVLLAAWQPGTYLALLLAWALPPIGVQLAFGADTLWRYGRLAILSVVPLTVFLSLADALAIRSGIWTINPQKSLGVLAGAVLPVEEIFFFLLTTVLVAFGVVLLLAPESQQRIRNARARWPNPSLSSLRADNQEWLLHRRASQMKANDDS